MKKVLVLLCSVLFNCVMGGVLASTVGVAPVFGALSMNAISMVAGALQPGALNATVYTEVWIGEVVKQFRKSENATFLDGVPDYSRYAENDVIHLVDAGIDPDVLVNNTTYPIPLQDLTDSDIAISLDKFQTKVTPITDDELYALSYDKIALVKDKHANAISDKKHDKAIHAFAPAQNSTNTPVLVTTGELVNNRRRLARKDIITLKKRLDDIGAPRKGRRLVLCSDHVEDLLLADQKFADQYYNYTSGKIANMYGFEIHEYISNPLYTSAGIKKAFGATASTGEYQASVFFNVSGVFKCGGSTKMYWSPSANDPEYQRNKVAFTHRFICMPKVSRGTGAIISSYEVGSTTPTITGATTIEADATAKTYTRTYNTSNGAEITVAKANTSDDWFTVSTTGKKISVTTTAFAYSASGTTPRTAEIKVGIAGTSVELTVTISQAMAANA